MILAFCWSTWGAEQVDVPRETMSSNPQIPAYVPNLVNDHMVSGEKFALVYNDRYKALETSPKPDISKIGQYYDSENYVSHTDGRSGLFERAYQIAKRFAIGRKLRLIRSLHPETGRILDYGAGTGDFLEESKRAGWNVFGIEPNERARILASKKGVDLVAERSELSIEKFDVITLWHVLEHLHDLDASIEYLVKHLADTGLLIIAVPNYRSWDAQHYGSHWAAYDVPRHLWHFSKHSMEVLFKGRLELFDIRPMRLDAFYVSLLSERYRNNRFGWPAAIWSGIRSNAYGRRHHEYSSHIYCFRKLTSDD